MGHGIPAGRRGLGWTLLGRTPRPETPECPRRSRRLIYRRIWGRYGSFVRTTRDGAADSTAGPGMVLVLGTDSSTTTDRPGTACEVAASQSRSLSLDGSATVVSSRMR